MGFISESGFGWERNDFTIAFSDEVKMASDSASSFFSGQNQYNRPISFPSSTENFKGCYQFCNKYNQAITLPSSAKDLSYMFYYSNGYNRVITIPSGSENLAYMFYGADLYDRRTTIPDSVSNTYEMFYGCPNFNNTVVINPRRNKSLDMDYMFENCVNFQQDITVPQSANYYALVGKYSYGSDYIYTGNIHMYAKSNSYKYGRDGSYSQAFSYYDRFNANIIFEYDGITDVSSMFMGSSNFGKPVDFPASVNNFRYTYQGTNINSLVTIHGDSDAERCFQGCKNLDVNIVIPSNSDISYFFSGCINYNQAAHVPSYTDGSSIFSGCTSLNSLVTFDDDIESLSSTFYSCRSLNQNIQLPSGSTELHSVFSGCSALNQNIKIPETVTIGSGLFNGCYSLDQEIILPDNLTEADDMFRGCASLTSDIVLPTSVVNAQFMFANCNQFSPLQLVIPSSVRNFNMIAANTKIYNIRIDSREFSEGNIQRLNLDTIDLGSKPQLSWSIVSDYSPAKEQEDDPIIISELKSKRIGKIEIPASAIVHRKSNPDATALEHFSYYSQSVLGYGDSDCKTIAEYFQRKGTKYAAKGWGFCNLIKLDGGNYAYVYRDYDNYYEASSGDPYDDKYYRYPLYSWIVEFY